MAGIKHHYKSFYEVLKNKPHVVGCEVGVHTGLMPMRLMRALPKIETYIVVDPWESYVKYDGKTYRKPGHKVIKTWDKAIMDFFKNTYKYRHKIMMLRMTSVQASKHFEDESLDWVFIDANHEYEYIKENLHIWSVKVKEGGVVAGHDYKNPKEKSKGWGITKAVDEFVPKNKLNVEPYCVWWYIK